jgi:DNA polymerase beta
MATIMDYKAIILKELDTMRKADIARRKPFQARAYAKVMAEISAMEGPITSWETVKGLPGIGEKIQEKIKEIIATGSLASATHARQEVSLDIMDALQNVHGIGPVKARELIDKKGIKSIEDLRKAVSEDPTLLNDVQKMGLKYYEDAVQRIPREEMVQHEALLLSGLDDRFQGTVVGSYRRGASDSGDIDVLLTLPDAMSSKDQGALFLYMIDLFKEIGYVIDTLALGPKKFMGYVRLEDGKARRLDLLMTPQSEYPYAILYFTGSQAFNMAFRKYVLQKGYTINEHRMAPTVEGVLPVPEMKTEEDIFAFLDLKYVEPTKRTGERDIQPIDSALSVAPAPSSKEGGAGKKTKRARSKSKTRAKKE